MRDGAGLDGPRIPRHRGAERARPAEAEIDARGEADVELGVGAEGPDEAEGALVGAAALALALACPGDAAGEPGVEGGADPPGGGGGRGRRRR